MRKEEKYQRALADQRIAFLSAFNRNGLGDLKELCSSSDLGFQSCED
jgi:hypothetical protein